MNKVKRKRMYAKACAILFSLPGIGIAEEAIEDDVDVFAKSTERKQSFRMWFDQDSPYLDEFSPPPAVEDGWIATEDDVWVDLVGQAGRHFRRAMDAYNQGRLRECSSQIRRGRAMLRLERVRAEGEARGAMVAAIYELKRVGESLQTEKHLSRRELERAFAHAHFALAYHHITKARTLLEKPRKLSASLHASALNTERSYEWAGLILDDNTTEAISDAKEVAEHLTAAKKMDPVRIQDVISALDQEVRLLGPKLDPSYPELERN